MRWITFLILLYVMSSLQLGRLGSLPPGLWPSIEFLPILAIFYALFAAESAAPLCGLICGLFYDLPWTTDTMLGTCAVPLALTTLLVVRIRLSIFREHVLSQLLMTFLAIMVFAILSVIVRLIIKASLEGGIFTYLGHMSANAIYSAIVAPLFFWLFFRFQSLLGFTSHGPRSRIHESRR